MKHLWKIAVLAFVLLFVAFWAYELIAVRGTFAPSRPESAAGGSAFLVGAPGHRIAGRVYLTGTPSPTAPLVVVLHGDAPFVNPGYQYGFASNLADAAPGTRVAALLRPGYADLYGAKSDGDRGFSSGENYTPEVIRNLAAAIQTLKSRWRASAVILLGHSGGAALAADIAALNPGLVSRAFLVSCPCDVPAFRRHMARLQWSPLWLLPTRSLSPLQTLDRLQKYASLMAISGTLDQITPPEYAQAYINKATQQGIAASLALLPGKGHEILNDPAVLSKVAESVRNHQ